MEQSNGSDLHRASQLLKDVFGYSTYLPEQEEVINSVLSGRDTMAIMPTGGGKSLTYQIPALIFEGLTLVVSPLISLMKDQVEQLLESSVSAGCLNSSMSLAEQSSTRKRLLNGEIKLLYLAPESLLRDNTLTMLDALQIEALVIDEAHCISEWGHDFRPEYRKIAGVRKRFPHAVCMALTATATKRVREDIRQSLNFSKDNIFISSFDRKNLFLEVRLKSQPLAQVLAFLETRKNDSGIIYCATRKQVDELSEELKYAGYSVLPYHAGMADADRHSNQEKFIRDDVSIIVATIAFGMGINKSNVRFVIHYDLPKNLESYYQEIGRSGRDGLEAHCLLLFGRGDIFTIKYFIDQKAEKEKKIAWHQLNTMVDYAESEQCRRIPLLGHFGENYNGENCKTCDNCTAEEKPENDLTLYAQKFLSCVRRSGEIYGVNHIADILRGSKAKKVLENRHDELSTYGIGTELKKEQWRHLQRLLLRRGLVEISNEYGSLKLKEKAWKVIREEEKFFGNMTIPSPEAPGKKSRTRIPDGGLFELLRKTRKVLADNAGLPPYVIFHDKTLAEMAARKPQSRETFLEITGVGQAKMEKYGSHFMNAIHRFMAENQNKLPVKKKKKSLRSVEVGNLFNSGINIQILASRLKIKEATVVQHLENFVSNGYTINEAGLRKELGNINLNRKETDRLFSEYGTEKLKPVFETLKESVSYEMLRLARLEYLSSTGQK